MLFISFSLVIGVLFIDARVSGLDKVNGISKVRNVLKIWVISEGTVFFSVFFLDSLVLAGTEDALNELHLSTYQFMSKELLYDGLLF